MTLSWLLARWGVGPLECARILGVPEYHIPINVHEIPEELFLRIDEVPGGCWEYRGRGTRRPAMCWKRRGKWVTVRASRAFWSLYNGLIPVGKIIHHDCQNVRCVNVDHLEPMTKREHYWLVHGSPG